MKPENPSEASVDTIDTSLGDVAFATEGAGPNVLLVPGLPGSVRDFRWLTPVLSPYFRCVRMTAPGFAETTRRQKRAHTIEERARAGLELLDALSIERCVVVTHSAGAQVGAWLAANTDRITHCAFISPPGPTPHFPQRTGQLISFGFRNAVTRAALDRLQRSAYKAAGFPSYLTDEERMYATIDAASMDFSAYTCWVDQIVQPTLLAWSNDDRVVPTDRFRALASRVPDGPRLEFEDAGHSPQKNYASEIGDAIVRFALDD